MMTGAPSGPSTSTFRLLSLICTNIRSPPSCPRLPGTSAGLVTPDPAQHPYGVASHHILDVLVGVVIGGPVPELPGASSELPALGHLRGEDRAVGALRPM